MSYYGRRSYDKDDIKASIYTLILCVICMAVLKGCDAAAESWKYANYIETEGTVTGSDAVVVKESNGKYTVEKDRMSVSYTYEVDGTQYTGAFVNDTSVSAGTKIKVLYDPYAPEQSKGSLYDPYGFLFEEEDDGWTYPEDGGQPDRYR